MNVSEPDVASWHGMMTSVVAAGNGGLSNGFYRGIAPDANVVLVKLAKTGRITEQNIQDPQPMTTTANMTSHEMVRSLAPSVGPREIWVIGGSSATTLDLGGGEPTKRTASRLIPHGSLGFSNKPRARCDSSQLIGFKLVVGDWLRV